MSETEDHTRTVEGFFPRPRHWGARGYEEEGR